MSELELSIADPYRVEDQGDEWLVKDLDGCAVAWVQTEPLAIETVLNVFWREPCGDDKDALEAIQEAAVNAVNREFQALWEKNGFVVPNYGELSEYQAQGVSHDFYRVWVSKPVTGLGEAADVIRWIASQKRDAWLDR